MMKDFLVFCFRFPRGALFPLHNPARQSRELGCRTAAESTSSFSLINSMWDDFCRSQSVGLFPFPFSRSSSTGREKVFLRISLSRRERTANERNFRPFDPRRFAAKSFLGRWKIYNCPERVVNGKAIKEQNLPTAESESSPARKMMSRRSLHFSGLDLCWWTVSLSRTGLLFL